MLLCAAAVLAVLVLLSPFEGFLDQLGLGLMTVAVLVYFVTKVWYNITHLQPGRVEPNESGLVIGVFAVTLCLFFGAVLFAPSDRWLQHGVSLYYAGWSALVVLQSFGGEAKLRNSEFGFRDWPTGKVNAARWLSLFSLAQCIANEALLRVLSPGEWIIVFALAPILFHYLYCWTVIATHPHEDQDDA